jgi:hypothetical protein
MTLTTIDETQTLKIIDKLKAKNSCGHDGLSTKLIKLIKLEVANPLTLIINQAINTGIFPDELKMPKLIPFSKKTMKCSSQITALSLFYLLFQKYLRECYSTSCMNTFNQTNFFMPVNMASERATPLNLRH